MPDANIVQSQNRHAYLIICHNNFKILQMLLSAIDDDRNDIYIHVDKKAVDVPFEDIRGAVCHSPLTFIERVSVNWGGTRRYVWSLRFCRRPRKQRMPIII